MRFSLVSLVAAMLLPAAMAVLSPECSTMFCQSDEVCRTYKPCWLNETCPLAGMCTKKKNDRGQECPAGTILYQDITGAMNDLPCNSRVPCPANAFCSDSLADAKSVCCIANPVHQKRAGVCPNAAKTAGKNCFTDRCKSDSDCTFPGDKCCSNGCKLECLMPTFVSAQTTQPAVIDPADPCKNYKCSSGQRCRVLKPCDLKQKCTLLALCTNLPSYRSDCPSGESMVYKDAFGNYDELVCYNGAPCPDNAFCSTALMDASSVCCIAKPPTERRAGICPPATTFPGQRCFTDQCKSDADCPFHGDKCCSNGCELECRKAKFPAAPITIPAAPKIDPKHPCRVWTCPSGEVCRAFKPCALNENCDLTAKCTTLKSHRQDCQIGGEAIMYRNDNGQDSDLFCYKGAPCPTNAFCSTLLMDAASVCCVSDPAARVKIGECPAHASDPTRRCFTDKCKSDGDCRDVEKCCFNGCEKECVLPAPPTPPPTPPAPAADPCDNRRCPYLTYCRRRGTPCRNQLYCGSEGHCTMCPFIFLTFDSFFNTDSDGCPSNKRRTPNVGERGSRRG